MTTQFTVAGDVSTFDAVAFRLSLLEHFTTGNYSNSGVHDVVVTIVSGSVVLGAVLSSPLFAKALRCARMGRSDKRRLELERRRARETAGKGSLV